MIPEFQYRGFQPDDHLVAESEGILERILALTPVGSTIVSLLEFNQDQYACSMDVFLRRGTVCASTSDADPFKALHRAEATLVEKLNQQKDTRFFSKKPEVLTNKNQKTF